MAERRKRGDGQLRRRRSGSWEFVYGGRSYTVAGKDATERKAERAAGKKMEEIKLGVDGRDTLEAWLVEWLEQRSHRLAYATIERYRGMFRTDVYPRIGGKRLEDVLPEDVQRVVTAMVNRGLAPASVIQCFRALSAALGKGRGGAVALRKLTVNPCDGVELPQAHDEETYCPTVTEVAEIMLAAPPPGDRCFSSSATPAAVAARRSQSRGPT